MVDMYNGIDLDSEESGPKALREALKKQKAENEELRKNNETLNKNLRTRTVSDVLKDKGLSGDKLAKVAAFVPEDADVEKWVADNGELFGIQVQASSTSTEEGAQQQEPQQFAPQGIQIGQGNEDLARQFAEFQALQAQASQQQTAAQANPQLAALDKAASENGARGIADFMRAAGLSA